MFLLINILLLTRILLHFVQLVAMNISRVYKRVLTRELREECTAGGGFSAATSRGRGVSGAWRHSPLSGMCN